MCKAVSVYVKEAYCSFLPLQLIMSFVIRGSFFSYGFCRQFEILWLLVLLFLSSCWHCLIISMWIIIHQAFCITIFSWTLLFVLLGNWEHWLNRVQEYNYPSDHKPEYSSILVPNVDNVRTSFLMETIAKQSKVGLTFTHSTEFIWSHMRN